MKILKVNIIGEFAFFKNKTNSRNNASYSSIHKPAILGLIGAVLGLDGFSDLKKNGFIDYIEKLSSINVGIRINNKINLVSVKTNDSTSLNITNTQNRVTQQIERILHNVSYDIYLEIENDELYTKIYNAFKEREFFFEPNLGKSYFPASIVSTEEYSVSDKKNFSNGFDSDNHSFYIETLFPTKYLDNDISDYDNEEFYGEIGIKYRLPVKSDSKTGSYIENDEFTYKSFVSKEDVLSNNSFKVINNELIYFI